MIRKKALAADCTAAGELKRSSVGSWELSK